MFGFGKRKEPQKRNANNSAVGLWLSGTNDSICCPGYTRLSDCPEVITCCSKIAQMISTMTVYLMTNTAKGDIRVHNELSRKLDINPSPYMTRKTWLESVVMNMLLYGKGNSIVLPHTQNGYLESLEVIPPYKVTFQQSTLDGNGYYVSINGKQYSPDEVLHFTYNPDEYYPWKGKGFTIYLKDIADNLKQANKTTKAFMSSKFKPSVIVKVDALTEEFASPEGRKRLLHDYIESSEEGEPWMIPAEQFSVEQVKPLSLADLAINDAVKIDKATIAYLLGVPKFLVGIDKFDRDEWETFVSTTIRNVADEIQQEMTKKLIISPKMYVKLNIWSLYNWNLKTISDVLLAGADRGYLTGNEWRDKVGLEPKDDLDELLILENYIPVSKSSKQKKLIQDGEE